MHKNEWNEVAEAVSFNLEIDLHRFSSEVSGENRILDYGCGYGRISKQLWDHGYKNIVSVDSSLKMIKRGNTEYPYLKLSAVSGNTLPFPDNSFDVVVVCAVFTCITSHEEVINTNTMGGRKASSYSLFARKSLKKTRIPTATQDTVMSDKPH